MIDTAAPATTASVAPAAANGWWRSPVVSLAATDAGEAGVAATEYAIDGGPWQTYGGPVTVTGDGVRTFAYRSRDAAGSVEDAHSLSLPVDGTAPAITLVVPAHADLARGERRTVSSNCADAGSGVASCTGAGRLDTKRAGRHELVLTATDVAGNTTTRRWTYTVLGRVPKLRVRAGGLTARGLRLSLTDRLRSAVKVTGVLRARNGSPTVRVRTTRVRLEARRTRTIRVRLAHRVHGAHVVVGTLRFATTSGKLHRTTTRKLRVLSR